jgi:hypothetical protein
VLNDRTVLHVDWEGFGRECLWSHNQHLPGLEVGGWGCNLRPEYKATVMKVKNGILFQVMVVT